MWQRSELKFRAKQNMNKCYWQAVLGALILGVVGGGNSNFRVNIDSDTKDIIDNLRYGADYTAVLLGILAAIVGVSLLGILGILLRIFIFAPIEIGCRRFFLFSRVQKTELNEIGFGFGPSYKNMVKIQFLRALYTALWSLLFVIPGIVKAYEYRMIPYLLAENPDLSSEEAFRISRELMDGEKWNAFVLDLSFFGWILLSACTCGILAIFYVAPYIAFTDTELYITLQNNRYNRFNMPGGNPDMGNPYRENSPYVNNDNSMM